MDENIFNCKHEDFEIFAQNGIEYARCTNCQGVRKLTQALSLYEINKLTCKICRMHHRKGAPCL